MSVDNPVTRKWSRDDNAVATWVEISGYCYRYRISDFGQVQRYWPSKDEWRNMTSFLRSKNPRHPKRLAVKLTTAPKESKNVFIADLMAEAFMGGRKNHPGQVLTHKNGCVVDFTLSNLEWVTQADIGDRYGGAGRKSIEKIDRQGNIVDLFASTSECCRHEYISRKSLWRILNNKVKDPFSLTGYTYRFEVVQ